MVDNGGEVDASLIKANGVLGIDLSAHDKEAIIAFLLTLTDNEFLEDERFSEY